MVLRNGLLEYKPAQTSPRYILDFNPPVSKITTSGICATYYFIKVL